MTIRWHRAQKVRIDNPWKYECSISVNESRRRPFTLAELYALYEAIFHKDISPGHPLAIYQNPSLYRYVCWFTVHVTFLISVSEQTDPSVFALCLNLISPLGFRH